METKQLNLRASGASRWIACPASARLSAQMPYQEGGDAAKIGTAIHALAEHCYIDDLDPMTFVGKEFEGITMTEENCDLPNNILTLFLLYTKSLNGIVMVLLKNFYPTKIPLHTSVVVLLISLPLALHGANSSLLT
jgi:hypothetical protein